MAAPSVEDAAGIEHRRPIGRDRGGNLEGTIGRSTIDCCPLTTRGRVPVALWLPSSTRAGACFDSNATPLRRLRTGLVSMGTSALEPSSKLIGVANDSVVKVASEFRQVRESTVR